MGDQYPPAYGSHRLMQLRRHCRGFRETLTEERREAFDRLLRDAAEAIKAGADSPDLYFNQVLTLSLALTLAERLAEVEGRLAVLEQLK